MKAIVNILNRNEVTTIPVRNAKYIEEFSNVTIENKIINKKNFFSFRRNYEIFKEAKIIHTHHTFSSLIASIFYLVFILSKKKRYFVHTVHRNFESFSGFMKFVYIFLIFPFRDYIIANSYTTKLSLEKHMTASAFLNIEVITNGVDLNYFTDISRESIEFDTINMVNVGRMVKIKNQSLLIHTLKELRDRNYDATLDFCGQGEEYKSLLELVVDNKLENYVKFHGMIPEHEVYKILKRSNFSIIPSFNEGFGVATIESMASGTITLGSNIAINNEIIQDKELLFSPFDHKQLTKLIIKFYSDKNLYFTKVDYLINRVQKYTAKNTAKNHFSFYKKLIG